MPGGSGPAQLARLPRLSDDAFRAFVRFPPGWSRAESGHYPDPEEFLVLEGELGLNGRTWRAGGYAWIPARGMRRDLHSRPGCLVFAWFAAAPRWFRGETVDRASTLGVSFVHWRDAPERRLAGDACARELHNGPEHHTWMVERQHLPLLSDRGRRFETLDLDGYAWQPSLPLDARGERTGFQLVRIWPS